MCYCSVFQLSYNTKGNGWTRYLLDISDSCPKELKFPIAQANKNKNIKDMQTTVNLDRSLNHKPNAHLGLIHQKILTCFNIFNSSICMQQLRSFVFCLLFSFSFSFFFFFEQSLCNMKLIFKPVPETVFLNN